MQEMSKLQKFYICNKKLRIFFLINLTEKLN